MIQLLIIQKAVETALIDVKMKFYNIVAKELIEEWINFKNRLRTGMTETLKIFLATRKKQKNEPLQLRADSTQVTEGKDGTKEWSAITAASQRYYF